MTEAHRTEDERLKRLRLLARSSIVGADIKWIVDEYDRLNVVFEEACNEVKACHDKPCFCKYCWEPSEATPGGGSPTSQLGARGVAPGRKDGTNE